MTKEQKQKLLRYLYPTEEMSSFLCNDVYQELSQLIKASTCISTKNQVNKVREDNLKAVRTTIKNFIENNNNYSIELNRLYKNRAIKDIVDDILMGYVFYLSNTIDRCKGVDIFKDKKSICYTEVSIIDIM